MNKASDLQFKLKQLPSPGCLGVHPKHCTNTFNKCLKVHKTVCVSSDVRWALCIVIIELYCDNCLFTRWCWVMVHAHWFPGALQWGGVWNTVNPLLRSDEDWKGHLCWKAVVVLFFCIPFKSLSHESWNLTPSFCFSFGCDTEGHKVCHSEAGNAFCGPQFKYICLCYS